MADEIIVILKENLLKEDQIAIGIDIGSTLIKLSVLFKEKVVFKSFNKNEYDQLERYLIQISDKVASCSGCGISINNYREMIEKTLKVDMKIDESEIVSLSRGLRFLSKFVNKDAQDNIFINADENNKDSVIWQLKTVDVMIASFGSSGQFIKVSEDVNNSKIVAANAEGGSSFLGLCKLLTRRNSIDYQQAIQLAGQGNHYNVDLVISDMKNVKKSKKNDNQMPTDHHHQNQEENYNVVDDNDKNIDNNYGQYHGQLVCAKYGKIAHGIISVDDAKIHDTLASVLHSIVSNETRSMYLAAKMENLNIIYVCGNFMNSPLNKRIFLDTVKSCDQFLHHHLQIIFIQPTGYLMSIGALANCF